MTAAVVTKKCPGARWAGVQIRPAHEAPNEEFASNKARPDGLARVCRADWKAYTDAARAAKVASGEAPAPKPPKPAAADNGEATAALDRIEHLSGSAMTEALGSDEGQAALAAAANGDREARLASKRAAEKIRRDRIKAEKVRADLTTAPE